MDFTEVSTSFLLGLTVDGEVAVEQSTSFLIVSSVEDNITTWGSTTFLAALHPIANPPPPHWHVQWRFIETRTT